MRPRGASFNLGIWKYLEPFRSLYKAIWFINTVTNLRHHQELVNTEHPVQQVITGIDKGLTNDILAREIRQALHHLGGITGEFTTDYLLNDFLSKFWIGN